MVKIALDAGHGINTPGKRCLKSLDPKETREWTLNSRIADYVEKNLKNYSGYELLRLDDRTGKTDVPLATRTSKANRWNADILISIHHNAGINEGSGGGIMVYRQTTSQAKTKAYQKKIYDKIINHTGLKGNRSTPLAISNLHMTRESKMPAVLIENGFMDSKTDVPIILTEKFARQSADALVEFLIEEFKLKIKVTPTKPTPIKNDDKGFYRVVVGSYKDKKNAEGQVKKLKAKGFDSFLAYYEK